MKLLVITSPTEVAQEAEKLTALFKEGLDVLHFRKPDWKLEQYERLLRKLPAEHYKKIVIHSHFKLMGKYNLKGIHLQSRLLAEAEDTNVKEAFKLASKRNLAVSASMHSFQEIKNSKWKFDYVFLSPVFDSISKKGYTSGFKPEELRAFISAHTLPVKLIALGGVDEGTIKQVKEYGFSGAALLGAIWESEDGVEKFKKIKELIKE